MMPGMIVAKNFTVKNTGKNPCWVRVKLVCTVDDSSLSADILTASLNTTEWIDGGDGYYYYADILQPGSVTGAVFTRLKISGTVDNRYLGKSITVALQADGVQSTDNDTASSVTQVTGWPAGE